MLPVVILAGGLATRLRPITEKIPKALVEVAGQPFLHHQMRLLAANGVTRVVMSVAYRGEMIEEFLGDGSRYGVEASYSYDGDQYLGTAGAIKKAMPPRCWRGWIRPRSSGWRRSWPRRARAAEGCFYWASADRRRMHRTR
ncbi:MAG: hypothetical protein FJW38_19835 [Acidobacteria bacterium]|nr:hypothetical protein [Acidobacteriota bacterium]